MRSSVKNRKMEECGNEGRVDEAQKLLSETEKLKQEEVQLQEAAKLVLRNSSYERPLKTCEICGALVDRVDPSRTLNHESGRTHQGFLLVREKAEELKEILRRREEDGESPEEESRRRRRKRKKRRSRSSSKDGSDFDSG